MSTPVPHELTPEESAKVQALRKALEEEFETNQNKPNASITDVTDLKPDALEALKYILRHGSKDDLRARIAMWVYDRTIDHEDKASTDKLLDLLSEMPKDTDKAAS